LGGGGGRGKRGGGNFADSVYIDPSLTKKKKGGRTSKYGGEKGGDGLMS